MFFEKAVRKLKHITDWHRREHAIVLLPNVPLRIHSVNGGYVFSVCFTEMGIYTYSDKRWGRCPQNKAVKSV